MRAITLFFIMTTLSSLLAVACGDGTVKGSTSNEATPSAPSSTRTDAGDVSSPRACTQPSHCVPLERCDTASGMCIPRTTCTAHDQCNYPEEYCSKYNVCEPGRPCIKNNDCDEYSELCTDGICLLRAAPRCMRDEDCWPGDQCAIQYSVPLGNRCACNRARPVSWFTISEPLMEQNDDGSLQKIYNRTTRPANGSITIHGNIHCSVHMQDDWRVIVQDQPLQRYGQATATEVLAVNPDESFAYEMTLPEGFTTVGIMSLPRSGNDFYEEALRLSFLVDTTPPTDPRLEFPSSVYDQRHPDIEDTTYSRNVFVRAAVDEQPYNIYSFEGPINLLIGEVAAPNACPTGEPIRYQTEGSDVDRDGVGFYHGCAEGGCFGESILVPITSIGDGLKYIGIQFIDQVGQASPCVTKPIWLYSQTFSVQLLSPRPWSIVSDCPGDHLPITVEINNPPPDTEQISLSFTVDKRFEPNHEGRIIESQFDTCYIATGCRVGRGEITVPVGTTTVDAIVESVIRSGFPTNQIFGELVMYIGLWARIPHERSWGHTIYPPPWTCR